MSYYVVSCVTMVYVFVLCSYMGMGQNPVPLVNIPKMNIIVFIGMFTYPILMVIDINPWLFDLKLERNPLHAEPEPTDNHRSLLQAKTRRMRSICCASFGSKKAWSKKHVQMYLRTKQEATYRQ